MHSITQFYSRAATNHACRRTKESFDLVSVKWMQTQRGELKQQQSSSMSKMVLEFQVPKEKTSWVITANFRRTKESFDLVSEILDFSLQNMKKNI